MSQWNPRFYFTITIIECVLCGRVSPLKFHSTPHFCWLTFTISIYIFFFFSNVLGGFFFFCDVLCTNSNCLYGSFNVDTFSTHFQNTIPCILPRWQIVVHLISNQKKEPQIRINAHTQFAYVWPNRAYYSQENNICIIL